MKQTNENRAHQAVLTFEYELDAPLAQVWRALTIPEYVVRWLVAPPVEFESGSDERRDALQPRPRSLRLLDAEPNRCVRYGWSEEVSPFLESVVTFRLNPNENGGTTFSIVHELGVTAKASASPIAANVNRPKLLLAA